MCKHFKYLFFFIFLFQIYSSAKEIPIGHNLTPTTHGLPRDSWTIGTYALAYGLTDNWSIGTSPWMLFGYNMAMVHNKLSFNLDSYLQKLSVEAMYFKSLPIFGEMYEQESIFIRTTISRQFDSVYTLYMSLGFQYFLYQYYTYSLHQRSAMGPKDRITLSASALHEIRFFKNMGILVELGFLGINYLNPYFHSGLSIFGIWDWGMIQLGLSQSIGFITTYRSAYWQEGQINTVVHPELQLQFFL